MALVPRLAAGCLLAGALLVPTRIPAVGAATPAAAAAQDADTPLDKALQQVEALLSTLRAQPGADPKLVEKLEEIAANLRKEKDALAAKAPGTPPAGAPAAENQAWLWARDTFFQGLDLKEEEKTAAEQVLLEFVTDYRLAKDSGDEKSKPVIRDHTEKRISRSFAPRDANKMKDNLDTLIKRWEWAGGRRGK